MLLRNNKVTLSAPATSPRPKRRATCTSVPDNSHSETYGECRWLQEYEDLPPIEETLLDIHPGSLDEPFYWCYRIGQACWVKVYDDGSENCEHRWQMGTIDDEVMEWVVCDQGILRQYVVGTIINGERLQFTIATGLKPNLLPDTPQVRDLLRRYGYDP